MFLCKHIQKIKNHHRHIKLEKDFDFVVFNRSDEVDAEKWNSIVRKKNPYLDLRYLKILEKLIADEFKSRYVLLYHKGKPMAVAYFQVIDFKASVFGDLLLTKVNQIKSAKERLFERYMDKSKNETVMRLLTCGNNVVSGEHGFLFAEQLSYEQQFRIIEELIEKIGSKEKLRGKISAVLVKDFYSPVKNTPRCLFNLKKYVEFKVEPNMVVPIPKEATSIEQYISLFSKKYRNRARTIFKNGEELTVKTLCSEEIKNIQPQLYNLYLQVYNHAKFKLIKLPEDYFYECKMLFGDQFLVNAFYHKNKLVAFSSAVNMSESCLEAHYIGLDYEANKQFEIYQNLLYHFLNTAIVLKKERLNLGRTAAEIKSTIGAKAEELTCYVKPQNTVSKFILKPFIHFLQPAQWVPRNPFKEEVKLSY